ncbi:O-antigen ligase family protein [Cellulomonas marina]|uniref:O-antigen ligase family protein n=1 Tax=Cellulomonas marina TaxID=988821 RepID=UPI001113F6B8|nr:O-antigen ligase family protein [Cellulomonas marina]GIG29370.1 hypothetical protein Cma02nite_19700 [Cellulomonas marina]
MRRLKAAYFLPLFAALPASLVAVSVGGRWAAVVVFACISSIVYIADEERVYLAAIALVPFIAGIRRISAGERGYVENDPLVLLPVMVAAPVLISILRSRVAVRRGGALLLLACCGSILVSAAVGLVQGQSAVLYGAILQLVPLVAGVGIACGLFVGLHLKVLRVAVATGVVVAVYGIMQRFYAPSWDLAWLRDRQEVLVSIGPPIQGQFRVFSTMESPGPYALFLAIAVTLCAVRAAYSDGRRAIFVAVALILFVAMCLSSVRAAIFAVPIALIVALVASRRLGAPGAVVLAGASVAIVSTLPVWLDRGGSESSVSAARYSLSALGEDGSFQERTELLAQFASVLRSPFGSGPGTVTPLDNGYLARGLELGMFGLVIFLAIVLLAVREGLRAAPTDAAAGLALSVVVLGAVFELSGAAVSGSIGYFFWPSVGYLFSDLVVRRGAALRQERPEGTVIA